MGLERTGTYSSWLNGKTERYIQTARGMLRFTVLQAMTDIQNLQHKDKISDPITFVLAKRSSHPTPTQIEQG